MKSILKINLQLLIILFFSFYTSDLFSQILTPAGIKNMQVQYLTNSQVLNIKSEMDRQNMSISMLENLSIENGMSASDFATLKSRLDAISPTSTDQSNIEKGTPVSDKPIELDKASAIEKSDIFGAEIFNNATLSFEPNANMATPANYILGTGDELQIVIYGMQEFSSQAVVSKEGKITIPIVGQVFVNGLTFDAARTQIKKACGKIYTSLNSGQSNLSVSLSKIRTIKVTIIGSKRPGNYSVSSLSTVFNALHIAGGPDANGSYRKIELIRNNKVIRIIDIYKFLTLGDQADNINLLENDVIRIPIYENRVKIDGNVKRAGIFELLPSESFKDLMTYCGGFDEAAYRKNIKLIQNSENGIRILDLTADLYNSYIPNSGDIFRVSKLLNRYENKVSVKGSVLRPDEYEFKEGLTIGSLIMKAEGLTEDAFKNRAQLIREKEDLTKEIVNIDLTKSNMDFKLRKNDELVIFSIFDLSHVKNVSIDGYVKNPGTYPYIQNLTLYDVIIQAGGFLEGSSKVVEISSLIIKDDAIKNQKENSIVKVIEIDTLLLDQSKNILLNPFDVVQIRRKPVYETQKSVFIDGPVVYPGSYVVSNKAERFYDILNRAGGLKVDANVNAISILRNGKMIPINYKKVISRPNSNSNIFMKPGDQITIKKLDNIVSVAGQVYLNTEVPFIKGKSVKYYVSSVGGFSENADKSRIYIVKANGLAKSTKNFLFFRSHPRIEPGAQVFVPVKVEKVKNNKLTTAELSIVGSAIASLTTTVIAIITLTK
ncbi:MAG: SLBB domain-containing protein [Flavobacteriia bacterium]|jgi:protein involved in polysaccharide export with SLBB domain